MPLYSFTSPEGDEYEINGPDGSTREQAFNILQEGIKVGHYKPKAKASPQEPTMGEKLKSGVNKAWEGVKNTLDTGVSLPAAGLAGIFGDTKGQEEIFKSLTQRTAARDKAAEGVDPGFLGKAAGVMATLPAQVLAMPFSAPDTMKNFIDKGETLKTAYGAGAIDTAGNAIGMMIPPFAGASRLARAGAGAAINAGQDTATRLALQQLAQQKETKEQYQPSLESAGLAALPGAGFGALSKGKQQSLSVSDTIRDNLVKKAESLKAKEVSLDSVDDQTVARLEAAIAKQNPELPPIMVGKGGDAFFRSDDTSLWRDKAQENVVDSLDIQREADFPERTLNAVQEEIPFSSSVEDVAAHQRNPAQGDLFLDRSLLDQIEQQTLKGSEHDLAWKQRAIERQAEQDVAAKQEQRVQDLEDTLMPLEEQLRAQQYAPDLQGQGPKTRAAKSALTGPLRKQGGAIDPRLAEDLYGFGKSIIRGADGVLKVLYHGTSSDKIFGSSFKKNPRGLFLTDDPKIASEYAKENDSKDVKYNQDSRKYESINTADRVIPVYVNIENPYRFTPEDTQVYRTVNNYAKYQKEMAVRVKQQGYDGIIYPDGAIVALDPSQIKSALSIDTGTKVNKFGQGGGINPQVFEDIVNLGKKIVGRSPKPDTLNTPRSAETIAARETKRAKASAAGIDVYGPVTTKEEALTNPGKDISRITQEAGAGIGGAVRRNPTNKPLKHAQYLLNTATNEINFFLKKFITGEDSFNSTHSKLSKQDKVDVFHVKQWLSDNKQDYTPEFGKEMGLSDKAQAHMEAAQRAYNEIAKDSAQMNLDKGLEPFVPRKGYFPSIWDGGFKALVGEKYKRADGTEGFRITDVISTKSRKEFNDAKKHYEGKEIVDLGRTGLRQDSGSRFGKRDDIAFLLNALAENDTRFADIKQQLNTANAISHKDYLGFGVHEIEKHGVGGFKGKKPWLSEAENMKEALEAEIQYFDQAAKYIAGQKLLDGVHDMTSELQLKGEMGNTTKYLDKWMNHLTGKGVEPSAAAINQIVDAGTMALGKVANSLGYKMSENPSAALRSMGTVMNALMMNIFHAPMFATQVIQLYQAGTPELIRAQQQYGLNPAAWATSMTRGHMYRSIIPALSKVGLLDHSKIPQHMIDAWHWMKDHGMDDFSEVMLSQDILENKATRMVKNTAFWPTVLPEKFTRPTFFMSMVDMFHQAGFETKDAIMRAKAATDYTMTDYRPEEAPLMYNRLGVLNPETSALQRYKHNALDQWTSRIKEAPEHKLAFATFVGLSIALSGLIGLPAMQELDNVLVKPLTKSLGKELSARELLMLALGSDSKAIDGLASAYTGLDIGSRFALADVAPNSFGEAVAGARLSKLFKMGAAAYDYGVNQDEQSLKLLGKELIPSGLTQLYSEGVMSNDKGQMQNKKAQIASGVERGEFPSKYALTGVRPLQEKVDSELNYTKNQRLLTLQDKQKTASERMKIALLNSDKAGFQRHLEKYQENFGDVSNIQNIVNDAIAKGYITEKQRLEGTPGKSPMSIKRFQEMQR